MVMVVITDAEGCVCVSVHVCEVWGEIRPF